MVRPTTEAQVGHEASPPSPLSQLVEGQFEPATSEESGSLVDLADHIIQLVRSWSHLKTRMASTVDPEISSLFLIRRLVKAGPTRAKDLAEAICADQSTVSRQVAGLVKAGLVERQADPEDGRASILVPTALGVGRLEKHFANRGQMLEPLVADWSEEDRRRFVELLRRFTLNLESRRDEVATSVTDSRTQAGVPAPPAGAELHQQQEFQPDQFRPQASIERYN